MVAGAIAGMGEHLAMFPVDTVKTRMQALAHPGQQASYSISLYSTHSYIPNTVNYLIH